MGSLSEKNTHLHDFKVTILMYSWPLLMAFFMVPRRLNRPERTHVSVWFWVMIFVVCSQQQLTSSTQQGWRETSINAEKEAKFFYAFWWTIALLPRFFFQFTVVSWYLGKCIQVETRNSLSLHFSQPTDSHGSWMGPETTGLGAKDSIDLAAWKKNQ